MSQPARRLREALSKAGIPATVISQALSPDRTITLALTITENPHGDIHDTTRSPTLEETQQALRILHGWAQCLQTH